jgi:hypothetical protein
VKESWGRLPAIKRSAPVGVPGQPRVVSGARGAQPIILSITYRQGKDNHPQGGKGGTPGLNLRMLIQV